MHTVIVPRNPSGLRLAHLPAVLVILSFLATVLLLAGCGDPPAAPKGLTVTSVTPITLSWSAVTAAQSYSVYRGTSSGGLGTKTRLATDITATSYVDSSAAAGTTYYYQVTAKNADGGSSASGEVQATQGGSSSFTLITKLADPGIELNWTTVTSAASYRVYRGTTATHLVLLNSDMTATTLTDTAVAVGITYYYQVAAVDRNGVELQRSSVTNGVTP